MHRRSVQCLADISSRAASSSKRSLVSESLLQCRHASTQALGKGKFTSIKSNDLKDVARLIVKQAKPKGKGAEKKGSKSKSNKGLLLFEPEDGAKQRSDIFLSDKSEFLSPRLDDPWQSDLELSGDEAVGRYNISRGTYLEVRRNNIIVRSIAVEVVPHGGRWMIMALTSAGEVWPCREDDVTFRIPGFADTNIVQKVGIESYSEDPVRVDARVKLVKQMRDFAREVEEQLAGISPTLRKVYAHFKAATPTQWSSVTLPEIAKFVDPTAEKPHVSSLLAIHNYLFHDSIHFLPDPTNFLDTHKFYLRPELQIEDAEFVNELVSRRDSRLTAFVAKALEQIQKTRDMQDDAWSGPPEIKPSSALGFTADEARILRFLDSTIRALKAVQTDPFLTPQAGVLKRITAYNEEINNNLTQRLMTDLGLLAPWQELIVREYLEGPESFSRSQRSDSKGMSPVATLAPTISEPLGPQDLYSRDPVESLRYDFGNMPVYVIDDYGAQELDDGVSIERIQSEPGSAWVHVHIADPTALVPPTNDIAKEAYRKAQTAYFLDRTIPMLPHSEPFTSLSLGVRSAQTGRPEPAMTFSIRVNTEGDIVETKVRPSVIKNVRIMKYSDVDAALGLPESVPRYPFGDVASQCSPHPLEQSVIDDLAFLREVTSRFVKKRYNAGIMTFGIPKAAVSLSPTPLPCVPRDFGQQYECRGFPNIQYHIINNVDNEKGSRGMVAEAMKLACRAASRFFVERGLSGIRRTLGPTYYGDEEAHAQLLAARSEEGIVDWISCIRAGVLSPVGKYSLKPEGHFSLGIPEGEGYMKVTSPLRRFQDMVAHWQIKHALLHPEKPVLFPDEWLMQVGEDAQLVEAGLRRVSWQQTLWYALRRIERARIERQKGISREHDPLEDLKGIVYQIPVKNAMTNAHQGVVHIPTLGIKAFLVKLSASDDFQIGDEVPVELGDILFGLRPRVDAILRR